MFLLLGRMMIRSSGQVLEGFQDVFGGGVHRLPAGDDGRHAQAGKDARDAGPRRNSDHRNLHGSSTLASSMEAFGAAFDVFHLGQQVFHRHFG